MGTLEIELLIGPTTFVTLFQDWRRQHGPSELMAIPDHDVPFGLGFIPTKANYRYMARLRKERVRARLTYTPFNYPVHLYTMCLVDYFMRASEPQTHSDRIIGGLSITQEVELQRLVHQLQLSDGAPDTSTSTSEDIVDGTVPHDEFIDEMLAISLSQIEEIVQLELASPFDLFEVSVIEIVEEILTALAPESTEDVLAADLFFDGPLGLVEGAMFEYLHVSYDITLSAPFSPTSQIFDIDDEIVQHDLDDDSSSVSYLDPIDQRVSLAIGDAEVVDFGHAGLDPSIVQHRLPLLPHARPRTWKRRLSLPSGVLIAISHAIRIEERRSHLSESTTTLFHDMMHRDVEVYVDDMIVKSRERSDHLAALERFFERIRQFTRHRGRSDKIRAILDMPGPRTRERSEASWSQPTVWDDQCHAHLRGSESTCCHLQSWCLLHQAVLYSILSVSDVALGCMLAQLDDSGKDRAIYYLSKRMLDYEMRYVMIEHYCLHCPSREHCCRSPSLITSFDGRALMMISRRGCRAVTSLSDLFRLAFSDRHPATNNIVEYEACILGLETALELGIRQMEVFGDSNLVLRQIQGEWKTRDAKLRPYHAYLELLVGRFDDLRYTSA
ncbi:hypothetical protein CK203_055364 [Vitis vinifera]|uniref:Uncharacterized protein n=1 Tax=Vitis vinifera TaxID=29760 RepID=A0A438GSZ9_VITVI|nr:hypothetical protein CK203_055364 [Vitis vinifera]